MSIEEKRRELFEAWASAHTKLRIPLHRFVSLPCVYAEDGTTMAWVGFNAALDAVAIELPETTYYSDRGYSYGVESCAKAINATGLGIKIK